MSMTRATRRHTIAHSRHTASLGDATVFGT
jgi:hypothetical protein